MLDLPRQPGAPHLPLQVPSVSRRRRRPGPRASERSLQSSRALGSNASAFAHRAQLPSAAGRRTRGAWRGGSCSRRAAGELACQPVPHQPLPWPACGLDFCWPNKAVAVAGHICACMLRLGSCRAPHFCTPPARRRKETHCEFCDSRLPDWKGTLTPQSGANAPAVMNVTFDGRTYSFEVGGGRPACAAAVAAAALGFPRCCHALWLKPAPTAVQLRRHPETLPAFAHPFPCHRPAGSQPVPCVSALCCAQVKPGPDGYRQFTESIRRAFNLPDDSELNITFTCDEPSTGQPTPQGWRAADGFRACAGGCGARADLPRMQRRSPACPRKPTLD